ncbi:MAG TPA: GNAT family N-acetyltransferase [Polyangiaceae bacterium LLY-WYZ-14_1]|nr:GNAT family N-acetyltransferase [Polyangiaceae bacterium LLY-WYZ-14_1]
MSVYVRFARPDDVGLVSQDGSIPREVVLRKINLEEVIVAEVDGKTVGYIRLEYLWSHVPYMALIYVLGTHRRRGVGRALLKFTTDYLRALGHEHFFSSSQDNEPEPQAWHRQVGFVDAGRIEGINPDGSTELFFRLKLR